MAKIERTSAGMREALFEELDRLRAGETTPQIAGAFSRLSSEITRNVMMEMKYRKQISDNDSNKLKKLPPLPLGIEQ